MKRTEVVKFLEIYAAEKEVINTPDDTVVLLLREYLNNTNTVENITNTQSNNRYLSKFLLGTSTDFSLKAFIEFCINKNPDIVESFMDDKLKDNSPRTRLIRRLLGENEKLESLLCINSMPNEVLVKINSYLNKHSFFNLSLVSKRFREVTSNQLKNKVFKNKLLKLSVNPKHLDRIEFENVNVDYEELYKNLSRLPKYLMLINSGLPDEWFKDILISRLDYPTLLLLSGNDKLVDKAIGEFQGKFILPPNIIYKPLNKFKGLYSHCILEVHAAIMTRSLSVVEKVLKSHNKTLDYLNQIQYLNHIALVGGHEILREILIVSKSLSRDCLTNSVNLFHYAVESGDINTIKLVKDIFDESKLSIHNSYRVINSRDAGSINALNHAIESGNNKVIEYLLNDLNMKIFEDDYYFDGEQMNIILHAFRRGNVQSVNLIIACLDQKSLNLMLTECNDKILFWAAKRGDVGLIKLAIELGVQVPDHDGTEDQYDIVDYAIRSRNPDAVTLCIKLLKDNFDYYDYKYAYLSYIVTSADFGIYEVIPSLMKEAAYLPKNPHDFRLIQRINKSKSLFKDEVIETFNKYLESVNDNALSQGLKPRK